MNTVSTESAESYEEANNIWMYNAFRTNAPKDADEQGICTWEEAKDKNRHYLDYFNNYLPKDSSVKNWGSIPWWHNPHVIPPDNATDDQIDFWMEYCARYANK